jgi:LysR family transcriptional regulator, glycine cleavage system transcriptional activator
MASTRWPVKRDLLKYQMNHIHHHPDAFWLDDEVSSFTLAFMRRLPPLATLRAFEAAARHLSFKAAADELRVTPTAISHQIKLLEEVLGVKLFRRRPRPLALTEVGAALFPIFRDGFDRFAGALESVRHVHNSRPLIVTTTTTFAAKWLMPRLASLQASVNGLTLEIDASETVVDLHAGQADAAIRYQQLPPPDLASIPLIRDHYLPVAAPALVERLGSVERPSDLARYPLIHFRWKRKDPHAPSWRRWVAEARRFDPDACSIEVQAGQRFSEAVLAIDAALAGHGAVLASDVDIAAELAAGRLVPLTHVALESLTYFLLVLPDHPRYAQIAGLAGWVRSELADQRFIYSQALSSSTG